METRVLQENIINGRNTLTAAMLSRSDTIYVISHDYVVDNSYGVVEIADNCVLDFRGGSISGGEMHGNKTAITAPPCRIFGDDMRFCGVWLVDECYPEWFGAKADGTTDDTNAIAKCFEMNANRVVMTNGVYAITKAIDITNADMIVRRNATVRAIAAIDEAMFSVNHYNDKKSVDSSINLKSFPEITGGGTIDCNDLAYVGLWFNNVYKTAVHALTIRYPIRAGLCFNRQFVSDVGNMDVYDIKIIGNPDFEKNNNYKFESESPYQHPVGILANRSDSIFENCIMIDFKTSMVITEGCKLTKVHPWLAHKELWKGSVAFAIDNNVLVEMFMCEADTIQTFAKFNADYATASIVGCRQLRNTYIVDNDDADKAGTVFIDLEGRKDLSITMFGNRIVHSDGIPHTVFKGDWQSHKIINLSAYCGSIGANTLGTFTSAINFLDTKQDFTTLKPQTDGITAINNLVESQRSLMYYHSGGSEGKATRTKWYNADGYRAEIYRKGTENTRDNRMPELDGLDAGVTYYNTEKTRHEFWKGNKWMAYKPMELSEAEMKTAGAINERPANAPTGFMYFDTTNNRPIWCTGNNTWVDAYGNNIT